VGAGYLGGIGLGVSYEMPENTVMADWSDGTVDNSIFESNSIGQSTQNYVEPLVERQFKFADVPRTDFLKIKSAFSEMGNGRPFWIDFTDKNHEYFIPGYMKLKNGIESPARESGVDAYSFGLTFQEAR
jgi:hypothetical protein